MTWEHATDADTEEGPDPWSPDEVAVETDDGTTVTDLHRPAEQAQGNRLTTEAVAEALDALDAGEDVWVDVVGGGEQIGRFSLGAPEGLED